MLKSLLKTIEYGLLGGICGAIAGFLLLFLIKGLMALLCLIFANSCQLEKNGPPLEFLAFLCLGSGTIIGGIFGALTAIKKL